MTEITWLTDDPPQKAVEFWKSEYPAISSIEENLERLSSAGFESVGHLVLPSADWHNFYGPLEGRLAEFRAKNSDNEDAVAVVDSQQQELDLWKECGDSYGYVFYLGRAV